MEGKEHKVFENLREMVSTDFYSYWYPTTLVSNCN